MKKESKDEIRKQFIGFISNALLLLITLFFGNYYINTKVFQLNQSRIEQQELITKKNDFIKSFTQLGQSRIYLAENYYLNYSNRESDTVLERSWEDYMSAIKQWNENNLLNPIFIKYYFGEKIQNAFYNKLLPKMIVLHESLLKIRDGEKPNNMEQIIEDAKHEMFIFSEGLIF